MKKTCAHHPISFQRDTVPQTNMCVRYLASVLLSVLTLALLSACSFFSAGEEDTTASPAALPVIQDAPYAQASLAAPAGGEAKLAQQEGLAEQGAADAKSYEPERLPDVPAAPGAAIEVELYGASGQGLQKTTVSIPGNKVEPMALAQAILDLKQSAIPSGTKLRSLQWSDGTVLQIDLSREFLQGSVHEHSLAVAQLVLGLSQIPEAEAVEILVDAKSLPSGFAEQQVVGPQPYDWWSSYAQ